MNLTSGWDPFPIPIEPKKPALSPDEFYSEIAALVRPLEGKTGPSFKEIDDRMWDEHGLPS